MSSGLPFSITADPCEIPDMNIGPFPSTTSAIETRLASPSPSEFVLSRVPPHVLADRSLEVEIAAVGLGAGASAVVPIASWISTHARLRIYVEVPGKPPGVGSVLVIARPSGGGWIIRALASPAAWADAESVTIVSLSLAGLPLPCDCLPATLRVGYNHTPAPDGTVHEAARAGDVSALQAALDAGGSTEEADENGRTASYWAACIGYLEALRMLLAAGANPAAANVDCWNPLHVAAYFGHTSIVALLLATPGVDPLAKDELGDTPLDDAQSNRKADAAALLRADPRVAAAAL